MSVHDLVERLLLISCENKTIEIAYAYGGSGLLARSGGVSAGSRNYRIGNRTRVVENKSPALSALSRRTSFAIPRSLRIV